MTTIRRRALVTGAAGTFGTHICAGLLRAGYETICVVRDSTRGAQLTTRLSALVGDASSLARMVECDLSLGRIIESAIPQALSGGRLDVLVNNAAVAPPLQAFSEEGVDMQWAVNVLSYHRVVNAALPALCLAESPRVVFVASQYAGGLELHDANFRQRPYEPHNAYRASKQANRCLAGAWAARHPRIFFASCHPGIADSSVARGLGMAFDGSDAAGAAGAVTPLFCATMSEADLRAPNGSYFVSSAPAHCSFSLDVAAGDRLWELLQG